MKSKTSSSNFKENNSRSRFNNHNNNNSSRSNKFYYKKENNTNPTRDNKTFSHDDYQQSKTNNQSASKSAMGFQSETSCGVGLDAADSSSQDADPDGLLSFDIIQSQQKKQLNNNNIKKINENKVSSSSSSSSPSSGSENEEEEEENESEAEDDETTELKAGDGGNAKQRVSSSSSSSTSFESTLGDNDKMPKSPPPRSSTKVKSFDEEIEELTEKSLEFISNGSFFGCGFYQFISFLFISIAWSVANGWYSYCSVFTGYTPEHTCDTKAMMLLLNESTSTSTPVSVMSDFVSSSVSSTEFDEKCFYRDSSTNSTGKCTKWIYDKSQMESTLITEFDFVCEKNYYFETAYSIEQIGYLIGTLGFSFLADKVGRKPVLCASLISMSIFGLVQTFTSNFYLFYMLGALINTLACGLDAVCVTMVLEMFTTNKRTLFGIGIEVIWVIVLALLSPLAYAIKKWRELRLVIFIILTIMSALSYWLVQESIRWLISDSRYTRAIKVIKRIAKFNKLDSHVDENEFNKTKYTLKIALAGLEKLNKPPLPPPSSRPSSSDAADESQPQFPLRRDNDTVANVFKNTKFRLYVIIMALNWFATALVYDGLTYMNNYISANIFFNWIIMNLIELPAQVVCYIIISCLGRRYTVCITLICAGLILLLTCLDLIESIHEHLSWIKPLLFVIAKFSITQSYSAVILHAPELFPTNLRSFGYGICLFSGKVTSVLSPIISLYLGKIFPLLPSIIYGFISIVCGFLSLYVPETLNRPLPNSLEDVISWPRTLSSDEWKLIRKSNLKKLPFYKKLRSSCNKNKRKQPEDQKLKCSSSTSSFDDNMSFIKDNKIEIVNEKMDPKYYLEKILENYDYTLTPSSSSANNANNCNNIIISNINKMKTSIVDAAIKEEDETTTATAAVALNDDDADENAASSSAAVATKQRSFGVYDPRNDDPQARRVLLVNFLRTSSLLSSQRQRDRDRERKNKRSSNGYNNNNKNQQQFRSTPMISKSNSSPSLTSPSPASSTFPTRTESLSKMDS